MQARCSFLAAGTGASGGDISGKKKQIAQFWRVVPGLWRQGPVSIVIHRINPDIVAIIPAALTELS